MPVFYHSDRAYKLLLYRPLDAPISIGDDQPPMLARKMGGFLAMLNF